MAAAARLQDPVGLLQEVLPYAAPKRPRHSRNQRSLLRPLYQGRQHLHAHNTHHLYAKVRYNWLLLAFLILRALSARGKVRLQRSCRCFL